MAKTSLHLSYTHPGLAQDHSHFSRDQRYNHQGNSQMVLPIHVAKDEYIEKTWFIG
jgi:hypothetical protein